MNELSVYKEKLLIETAHYYADLAKDYDNVAGYNDPVSEKMRESIKSQFRHLFEGYRVLEIACGTGYWTKVICMTAEFVVATDVNTEMIDIAKNKLQNSQNVSFRVVDAYTLDGIDANFTAGFSHWWWSHMPRNYLIKFLTAFHNILPKDALVLHVDQLTSENDTRRFDDNGNTIEDRLLPNGNKYTIVKNFPSLREIKETLKPYANKIEYKAQTEKNMWSVTYRVKHSCP